MVYNKVICKRKSGHGGAARWRTHMMKVFRSGRAQQGASYTLGKAMRDAKRTYH